ncbi:MAG: hypothetical protein CBC38_02285 [Gammaproteobacteria bacterium TMED78]|nr:MAG: hypothetical protein CBC38_02285 [Gammaproteobacteria bacterium TMED78]|tara:strand:+ start:2999 stop:3643 length:645 start_codon:yes stop_codon:yes gene_type:complete
MSYFKNISLIVLFAYFIINTAQSQNTVPQFNEGTHYSILSPTQPTSSSPDVIEVAEVFWYGCPHCFTLDPYLENWRESLSEDVNFIRIPAVWNSTLQTHARAFYAAEALGIADEIHVPIFREIHINRNFLDTNDSLVSFFSNQGIDDQEFMRTLESFSVHTKLQRADELSRRYRIASVPTIIINGKYTTDAGQAGGYDLLIDLINYLVSMERDQ